MSEHLVHSPHRDPVDLHLLASAINSLSQQTAQMEARIMARIDDLSGDVAELRRTQSESAVKHTQLEGRIVRIEEDRLKTDGTFREAFDKIRALASEVKRLSLIAAGIGGAIALVQYGPALAQFLARFGK